MRELREILRLRCDAGLSDREIGLSCNMATSPVSDCLIRLKTSGLSWPLPLELDDGALESRLYREHQGPPSDREAPDWKWVHQELRQNQVTLSLLWQEDKQSHTNGYQYSWCWHQYERSRGCLDPVMRQSHQAGQKCFVDDAGSPLRVTDPQTGETRPAYLVLGVLGASSSTYAEASVREDLPSWLASPVRMVQDFQGVPEILVPDHLKAGVTTPNSDDPEMHRSSLDLANHDGIVVIPARPRKRRDKAKVEPGVLFAEWWILASLRHRTFFSVHELNVAIRERLESLNSRPFQK